MVVVGRSSIWAGLKKLNCVCGLDRFKAIHSFFYEKKSKCFCWVDKRAGPINAGLNKWVAQLSPRTDLLGLAHACGPKVNLKVG